MGQALSAPKHPTRLHHQNQNQNPRLNNGVTDAACAKCADGYQWWPCNTDSCECSGSALFQVEPKMVPIKRTSRSKKGHAFLAPDNAMFQMKHTMVCLA